MVLMILIMDMIIMMMMTTTMVMNVSLHVRETLLRNPCIRVLLLLLLAWVLELARLMPGLYSCTRNLSWAHSNPKRKILKNTNFSEAVMLYRVLRFSKRVQNASVG